MDQDTEALRQWTLARVNYFVTKLQQEDDSIRLDGLLFALRKVIQTSEEKMHSLACKTYQ